jgi:hypothetical protein
MDVSVIVDDFDDDALGDDNYILGAVMSRAPQPKLDDPLFDRINFSKLPNIDPDGDQPNPQFIIWKDDDGLIAKLETTENDQTQIVAQKKITEKEAYTYLFKLSESYPIIDVEGGIHIEPDNGTHENVPKFKDHLKGRLDKIAKAVPELLSWAIKKSEITKDELIESLNDVYDAKTLNQFLENQDVIAIIGKDIVKEYRKKLAKMAPRKYIDLQSQASVLKEIGGQPNLLLREISRGTVHDSVIANILSGSISTFGLYNVMQAIESAPKNAYTRLERRNWSVLGLMTPREKITIADMIMNKTGTVEDFVNALDLVLRVLSNPTDASAEIVKPFKLTTEKLILDHNLLDYYVMVSNGIESDRFMYKYGAFRDYMVANYTIPLPGLEGLVHKIEETGIPYWIERRLPKVTQFQLLN